MRLFSLQYSNKKGDIEETLFFNFPFDKGRLKNMVCWFFEKHGQYKTLKFLEKLKEVGFGSATTAGISLGIDDLKIPSQKIALVSTAETKVAKDLVQYRNAKITGIERIQRLISTWNQTNDTLKQEVVRLFESTDLFNPIYMMAFSGARGNMSQVRQLVGMRGLMSDPQGQIIDFPIQSNFREGLTLTEYLISTYGARKGIVDTALRTATAGYLTRRLVDVAQHTIVSKFDCGTMRGIFLFDMKDGKKTIYSFQNRLIGRVLAQNIEEKKQLAFRNQEIDSKLARAISNVTKKAFVRSPLTCETSRFVCQLCYGWSLSHGKLVSVGEAVGIIAAQSIGEPGTQLTMRTFHTGGVFAGGLTDQILAPFDGKMKYLKNIPGTCVRNALSEIAFLTKTPGSFLIEKALPFSRDRKQDPSLFGPHPASKEKKGEIFKIPAYALLFCRNNEFVRKKQVLAQFSSVLKKMQYGSAEQTLYSTLSGEFVFGKSFFFQQKPKIPQNSFFLQSEFDSGPEKNFPTDSKPSISFHKKEGQNFGFSTEQFLLLERRKGDFSSDSALPPAGEAEFKNDILWKSQNWTTVWILSGNVFRDSLNTNFPFREGDLLKKTSVLQRILWTKKKQYQYFLYENGHIQEKRKKTYESFFAFEKKKIHDSFFSDFSFSEKRIVQEGHKNSGIRNVKTNLSPRFLLKKRKKNSSFNSFEKLFSYLWLINKRGAGGTGQRIGPKAFFESEKKNDFLFIQNKSTRFFSDFQKNNTNFVTFLQKKRSLSLSFFSSGKTRKAESLSSQTKKNNVFEKDQKNVGTSLFFKFLNKRKNFAFPFFLNFKTFSKTFHVSQKFGFFSFFLNDFSQTSYLQSHFIFSKKKSKNIIFSSAMLLQPFGNFSCPSFFQNQQVSSFSYIFKKRREKKKIILKTSLFLNQHQKNQKEKKYKHTFSQEKKKSREKNIVLKKFFLRLPVDKMYYKKFAYFVIFSAGGEKKKIKSSFQTFCTLMKNENSLALKRNIGKAEPLFIESQNFYGKETPNSFTNCFFENSQTNTGGIFSFCVFEHDSKKQRIFYFCEKFSEYNKNKILFLIPENVQKMYLLNNKKQKIPFFSLSKQGNFSPHAAVRTADGLCPPKRGDGAICLPLPIHTPDRGDGCSQNEESSSFLFVIPNNKKTNLVPLFFPFSENESGKNFSKNETNSQFWETENSFQTVFSEPLFQTLKKEQTKSEKNVSLLTQYKRFVFCFCGAEPTISRLGGGKAQPRPLLLQKTDGCNWRSGIGQNKKEKSFFLDFYTQEIFWLPQENFVIFTSDISKEDISNLSCFPFSSHSGKKPFLFFANRQGKKKIFSFFPQSFSSSNSQKEKKQKAFEGFLRVSKRSVSQTSLLPGLKTNKKRKTFFPLHQKFSFFSRVQKGKQKLLGNFNSQNVNFQIDRGQVDKTQIGLFDQFGIKSIRLKFQKRHGNKKFTNIQYIFSKKMTSFQSLSPNRFQKNSFPLDQTPSMCSKLVYEGKKNMTVFKKHLKNSYFFAKKMQNQCFTCLPFQKNSFSGVSVPSPSEIKRDHKRKNFSEKKKKLHFKIEQGWLVFPVLPSSKKIFFKNHKRIEKKGHFFDKDITFEQNNVFVETVLFQNFSFLNSKTNFFVKTEKNSFQLDFVQTNSKCRYLSFFSFQEKRKNDFNSSQIFSSFEKKQAVQFPNFFPPIHQCFRLQTSRFSIAAQPMKSMKKIYVMQFFRPFQYKILQNPQNAKKFLRDIRFQYFSKGISGSCVQLYKKYHSSLFNIHPFPCFSLQNEERQIDGKKENEVFGFFSKSQNKKNKNFKFEVWSNFQNLYFFPEKSSFFSFEFSCEQENFKKKFKKVQQNFQEFLLDKKEVAPISNTLSPSFLQTFRGNVQKNFFFSFGKAYKEKKNFSFYPIQFLPLVLSLSSFTSKNSFSLKNKISNQFILPASSLPSIRTPSGGAEEWGSVPNFSLNPLQNTIEFQISQKRGTFFDERFSYQKFFDFLPTSSFWLNKDRMNFLFSTVSKHKNSQKIQSKENQNCIKNSVFEKNIHFYGSTEFLSPYEGEILSMFTHNMYWWKKASEISTIQNFENLFTILTKKDFFSVQFPSFSSPQHSGVQKTKETLFFSRSKESKFFKQKHLKKLYEVLTNISQQKNSFFALKDQNEKKTKTKISSFVTKYEKKIYTFQNLTIGYPSLYQKPVLGNFVVYGDNFFGSSVQKPGQIIHFSSSSMTLRRGQPCLVSSNGILHFSNTPYIQKNVPLVTLPYQTVQAGDIVQGIPKVEQFFEARTTLQGRLFVSSLPILLKGIFERYKILLPLDQATRQSFLKIQQIIVDGVQRVYRSQGVSITDKHLEVVVRQMTTKVQILNGAQTGFFPGELVDLNLVERLNKFLMVKICYEPVILGITRASLEVESFLSASSFQQTTKILSLAAISRKKDFLKGLKENLLVGNLIPSGTGYFQFSKRF